MAQHFLQLSTPNMKLYFSTTHTQHVSVILGPLTTNRKRTARNLGVIIDSDLSFEPRAYHISTGLLLNSTAQKSKKETNPSTSVWNTFCCCVYDTHL